MRAALGAPDYVEFLANMWGSEPDAWRDDLAILCGHWSALGFRQTDRLLALDSGCLWGGSLTAVRLEDRRIYQMPCGQLARPSGWQ